MAQELLAHPTTTTSSPRRPVASPIASTVPMPISIIIIIITPTKHQATTGTA